MNEASRWRQNLCDLVGSICNDTLSPIELQSLQGMLRNNPDARELYQDYMQLHAELHWQESALADVARQLPHVIGVGSLPLPSQEPARFFISPRLAAAVLCGILLAYFTGLAVFVSLRERTPQPLASTPASEEESPVPVATLTCAEDCVWNVANLRESLTTGTRLQAGESVSLDRGVAELTLSDGARLTLEGPAKFELASSNSGRLHTGKLVALVPKRAQGFAISTPTARVVDLGTEFGVEVSQDGASRVDVFQGKVQVQTTQKMGTQPPPRVLHAAEAITISPTSNVQIQSAEPSRFRRSVPSNARRWATLSVRSYAYVSEIGPAPDAYRNDPRCRKLIDGTRGSFDHTDGLWVGFEDLYGIRQDRGEKVAKRDDGRPQPTIRFILDSNAATRTIDAVRITYLVWSGVAIHAPNLLRVRTADSEAALTSSPWTEITNFDDQPSVEGINAGSVKSSTFELSGLRGPCVELEFLNTKEWTYLSEITFLHAETNATKKGD